MSIETLTIPNYHVNIIFVLQSIKNIYRPLRPQERHFAAKKKKGGGKKQVSRRLLQTIRDKGVLISTASLDQELIRNPDGSLQRALNGSVIRTMLIASLENGGRPFTLGPTALKYREMDFEADFGFILKDLTGVKPAEAHTLWKTLAAMDDAELIDSFYMAAESLIKLNILICTTPREKDPAKKLYAFSESGVKPAVEQVVLLDEIERGMQGHRNNGNLFNN